MESWYQKYYTKIPLRQDLNGIPNYPVATTSSSLGSFDKLKTHNHEAPETTITNNKLLPTQFFPPKEKVSVFLLSGFFVGVLVAIATFLPIYVVMKDSESNGSNVSSNNEIVILIGGTAVQENWNYTDQLSNSSSPEFISLADEFCSMVTAAVSPQSCRVTRFYSGSVGVDFELGVSDNNDNLERISKINASLNAVFHTVLIGEQMVFVIGNNDCLNNLCENGATCIDGANNYFCSCPMGSYGTYCNYSLPDCPTDVTVSDVTTEAQSQTSVMSEQTTVQSQPVTTPNDQEITTPNIQSTPCPTCENCSSVVMTTPEPESCNNTCTECEVCSNTTCNCTSNEFVQTTPADCLCNMTTEMPTTVACVNESSTCEPCNETSSNYSCPTISPDPSPCELEMCQNNGTCLTGVNGTAVCICAAGWTGVNCTQQLMCFFDPCANGTCIDQVNNYTCICDPGFTGRQCDTQIVSPCEVGSCAENATCLVTRDKMDFFCLCPEGYTGRTCNESITLFCEQYEPCEMGTCVDTLDDGQYVCLCSDGFYGTNCSQNLPCNPNPCNNNGSCHNLLEETPDYVCICPEDYNTVNCSLPTESACDANPCNETAECINNLGGNFTCLCDSNHYGRLCNDLVPGPCSQQNCSDHGTCQPSDFTCSCEEGFEGQFCNDVITFGCDGNPCRNGATCHNLTDSNVGYFCECTANFTGQNCSESLDMCVHNFCENNSTCVTTIYGDYVCICGDAGSGKNCSIEAATEPSCPTNFVYILEKCYNISNTAMPRVNAISYCESIDGTHGASSPYNSDDLETIANTFNW